MKTDDVRKAIALQKTLEPFLREVPAKIAIYVLLNLLTEAAVEMGLPTDLLVKEIQNVLDKKKRFGAQGKGE